MSEGVEDMFNKAWDSLWRIRLSIATDHDAYTSEYQWLEIKQGEYAVELRPCLQTSCGHLVEHHENLLLDWGGHGLFLYSHPPIDAHSTHL